MQLNALNSTLAVLAGAALLGAAAQGAEPRAAGAAGTASYEKDIQPLIQKYCVDCHGPTRPKADLNLSLFTNEAAVRAARPTWERVLHALQKREMPPEKKPQPTELEHDQIASWIQSELFTVDCENPDPGRVTIRRLNRTEYNNTIRDLVGVDFQPADDFPADDAGYGFDNIGDALSLPPVLLEKYLLAAQRILDSAIVTEDPSVSQVRRFKGDSLTPDAEAAGETMSGNWLQLGREGEAFIEVPVLAEGGYKLRVKAYAQQAGPELARLSLRLNGSDILKTEVKAARQREAETFEAEVKLKARSNRLAVAYLNNYVNQNDPDPNNRDRNLFVAYIELEGPFNAGKFAYPETHRRIFPLEEMPADKRGYARDILRKFASKAFRRPATDGELDRLMKFVDMAAADGDSFEKSVQLALQATLVSPHFLFRGELQPEPDNPKYVHPVNEFALASRLSYFLWSSLPDDELFALAQRGALRANLAAQVKRMLQDPKSAALVKNFAGQWLELRNLNLVTPDAWEFPEFDKELRAAMLRETELFFEHIMRENRSVLEFLDADYTFANARLARHYGLPEVKGDEFQRVSLRGTERGGLLTQASILTITSNPTRTSPVKRGKWVLENILGAPPPPPPPDVPLLDEEKKALTGTLRQRMEQHRENPNCAGCHARMDPIGFSFENFNAIGGFRKVDGTSAIDPSGKLVSGETFSNPAALKAILRESKRPEFLHCLTEKMLTYALGRGVEYYDVCAIDKAIEGMEKSNYSFQSLVVEIVNSAPFQKRRGEEVKAPEAE